MRIPIKATVRDPMNQARYNQRFRNPRTMSCDAAGPYIWVMCGRLLVGKENLHFAAGPSYVYDYRTWFCGKLTGSGRYRSHSFLGRASGKEP